MLILKGPSVWRKYNVNVLPFYGFWGFPKGVYAGGGGRVSLHTREEL